MVADDGAALDYFGNSVLSSTMALLLVVHLVMMTREMPVDQSMFILDLYALCIIGCGSNYI